MSARDEAVKLLTHYFALAMTTHTDRPRNMRPTLNSDAQAEIETAVDFIIDAAAEKTLRMIDNRKE